MSAAVIELRSVERHYVQGSRKLTILNGADFALVPGEAYFIKMNTTVNYIPSHY